MTDLKLFDAEVTVGRLPGRTDNPVPDPSALLREMDYFGIDSALFATTVAAFGPEGVIEANRQTERGARASSRLVPCWTLALSPYRRGEQLNSQVDQMLSRGFRCARLAPEAGPAANPARLKLWALEETLGALAAHRVPLLVPVEHIPAGDPALAYDFDDVDAVCARFPELPVVLLRPRYNSISAVIALMRRHRRLHTTLTLWSLFGGIESLVEIAGAERLLYGSNLPHVDPGPAIGAVAYCGLPEDKRRLIAGGNLAGLIGGVR